MFEQVTIFETCPLNAIDEGHSDEQAVGVATVSNSSQSNVNGFATFS